jgi:hypothetical protein
LDDGTIATFDNGEPYGDAVVTRCGSVTDYPCFCNPQAVDQAECPYCGFVTGDGNLYCAKHDETIVFVDGSINRECSCIIPDGYPLEEDDIRTCTIANDNATITTLAPTTTVLPEDGTTTAPAAAPIAESCTVTDVNGTEVFIELGDSFGELVTGPCGPAEDWPAYCTVPFEVPETNETETITEAPSIIMVDGNSTTAPPTAATIEDENATATTPPMEEDEDETNSTTRQSSGGSSNDVQYNDPNVLYPYCVFENTDSGDIVCARDFESVDYTDEEGNTLTCSCALDANLVPQSDCQPAKETKPPKDEEEEDDGDKTDAPTGPPEPSSASANKNKGRTIAIATSCGLVGLTALVAGYYKL